MNDKDVSQLSEDEQQDLLDRAQFAFDNDEAVRSDVLEWRGGCRCFMSPPCWACSTPLDLDEALRIVDRYVDAGNCPQGRAESGQIKEGLK